MIRRARTATALATADRLARRCGPANGKPPSTAIDYAGGGAVWVASVCGHVVAYAAGYLGEEGLEAHFSQVGVLPAFRGRGLQRRFVRAFLRWAREQGAKRVLSYTSADNWFSLANLGRCGFVACGFRADDTASGNGWVDVQVEL